MWRGVIPAHAKQEIFEMVRSIPRDRTQSSHKAVGTIDG
jgi:hypothetical protein